VPRVVGRIAADGTFDTSTIIPDLDDGTGADSGSPRSAISTNGADIWVTGAEGGVRYTTLGNTGPTTQINSDITNLRHIDIFNGQLYTSTMSGNTVRIASVGTAVPTSTGQTLTALPGVPGNGGTAATNPDQTQFWMADLSSTEPGADTLYVADSRNQANNGGLYKYSFVSGTWVANGGLFGTQTPPTSILRGIVGEVNGSTVNIYMTRNNGQQLMKVVDTTGYNGTLGGAATVLTTLTSPSPGNWKFAGLDFVPVAGVPGDFDHDTMVDDDDFNVWTTNFGTGTGADADGDGDSDGVDFLTWQRNYGVGVPAAVSGGAVPEPGAAILAAIGLVGAVAHGRRRAEVTAERFQARFIQH
jgi:hypothetical protein